MALYDEFKRFKAGLKVPTGLITPEVQKFISPGLEKALFFDIETGGLDPSTPIYEMGFLSKGRGRRKFVQPGMPVSGMSEFSQNIIAGREAGTTQAIESSTVTQRRAASEALRTFGGKDVWVQNLKFESKFLGERIPAEQMQRTAKRQGWESFSADPSSRIFPTDLNIRALKEKAGKTERLAKQAHKVGPQRDLFLKQWEDVFTKGFKPALSKARPEGVTRFFDIQDLTQSVFAMAQNRGYMAKTGELMTGTSVDLFSRLALGIPEPHTALGDSLIQEKMTQTFLESGQRMSTGQALTGPQREYFKKVGILQPQLRQEGAVKRILGAMGDLEEWGVYNPVSEVKTTAKEMMVRGPGGVYAQESMDVTFGVKKGQGYRSIEGAVSHMKAGEIARLGPTPNYESALLTARQLMGQSGQQVEAAKALADANKLTAITKVKEARIGGIGGLGWKVGLGAAAAVVAGSVISGNDDEYNYIEGLRHGGVGEANRRALTDFGSGYRGSILIPFELGSTLGMIGGAFGFVYKKPTAAMAAKGTKDFTKISTWKEALSKQLSASSPEKVRAQAKGLLSEIEIAHQSGFKAPMFISQFGIEAESLTPRAIDFFVKDTGIPRETLLKKITEALPYGQTVAQRQKTQGKILRGAIAHERVHFRFGQEIAQGETPAGWADVMRETPVYKELPHAWYEEYHAFKAQHKVHPEGLLPNIRQFFERKTYRTSKYASKKTEPFNPVEGLKHGETNLPVEPAGSNKNVAGPARKSTTAFGSSWNALRGLLMHGETMAQMTATRGFKSAMGAATEVGALGEGAFGIVRRMRSGPFREMREGFEFARKELKDISPDPFVLAEMTPVQQRRAIRAKTAEDELSFRREAIKTQRASKTVGPDIYGSTSRSIDMELFQGTSIGRLEGVEKKATLPKAMIALKKLHGAGVVHKDIHGYNLVRIEQGEGAGKIGIIDYGKALLRKGKGFIPQRGKPFQIQGLGHGEHAVAGAGGNQNIAGATRSLATDFASSLKKFIDVSRALADMGVKRGEYAFVGSAGMEARGIRKAGDVDLVLGSDVYQKLKGQFGEEAGKIAGIGEGRLNLSAQVGHDVEAFPFWMQGGRDLTTLRQRGQIETVGGIEVLTAQGMADYKTAMGRGKDHADLTLLAENLSVGALDSVHHGSVPGFGKAIGGGAGKMIKSITQLQRKIKTGFGSGWHGLAYGAHNYLSATAAASGTHSSGGMGEGLNPGFAGKGYAEVGIKKYIIEDADTVKLMLKGGNHVTFRLAGIDAPEVAHDEPYAKRKVFQNQPYGRQATGVLEGLLASQSSLKAVFDPSATRTYGRTVAVLIGDEGLNVNLELVRKGAAGALPYGTRAEQLINPTTFRRAERHAAEGQLGMWSEKSWQVARNLQAGAKHRITNTTFTSPHRLYENFRASSIAMRMHNPDSDFANIIAAGGKNDHNVIEGMRHGWFGSLRETNIGDFGSGYVISKAIPRVAGRTRKTESSLLRAGRLGRNYLRVQMRHKIGGAIRHHQG